MSKNPTKSYTTKLKRGGIVVSTSIGPIQFGAPPETIKDTIVLPFGVPQIFVLPNRFFDTEKGISLAEIEFPIYYNFFLKNRKIIVISPEDRIPHIKSAMQEAIFGPNNVDVTQDYPEGTPKDEIPNMDKEIQYFRNTLQLNDLLEFVPIVNNTAKIGNVSIEYNNNNYHIRDLGELVTVVKIELEFSFIYEIGNITDNFTPPRMGVTCLGSSHGFDPNGNTSGFIIWINGRGIMIDPPFSSTEWLTRSNVNPKLIDSIILTHCHADHDSGTFQKILAAERINIYTTKTIMDSFTRKYAALIGNRIKSTDITNNMCNFHRVIIGQSININNAEFIFFYSLHSIPTIGFHIKFRNKKLYYSSDHVRSVKIYAELKEKGILNEFRHNKLLNTDFDSYDLIYHEAGIPPVHTDVNELGDLPDNIKNKMQIYHIAEKDVPPESKLSIAKFGIENTINIDIQSSPFDDACDILSTFEKVEFFNSFTLSKVYQLLGVVKIKKFIKDSVIVEKGSKGKYFYILISGYVSIRDDNASVSKQFGPYDSFGEVSLLLNEKRTASVIADSDVVLITISKKNFLFLIDNTSLYSRLMHLSKYRNINIWQIISEGIFKNTSSYQKTAFESILEEFKSFSNEVIILEGSLFNEVYLIYEGYVTSIDSNNKQVTYQPGNIIGDIFELKDNKHSSKTYITGTDTILYKIKKDNIVNFMKNYPNMYIGLLYKYNNNI